MAAYEKQAWLDYVTQFDQSTFSDQDIARRPDLMDNIDVSALEEDRLVVVSRTAPRIAIANFSRSFISLFICTHGIMHMVKYILVDLDFKVAQLQLCIFSVYRAVVLTPHVCFSKKMSIKDCI